MAMFYNSTSVLILSEKDFIDKPIKGENESNFLQKLKTSGYRDLGEQYRLASVVLYTDPDTGLREVKKCRW